MKWKNLCHRRKHRNSRWQTLYHQIWHPGSSPYWETSKKNPQFLQLINTSPGVWQFFSEFLVWRYQFRGSRQIGSSKETQQLSCSFVESNQWEWGNPLQVREALDRFKDLLKNVSHRSPLHNNLTILVASCGCLVTLTKIEFIKGFQASKLALKATETTSENHK